MQETSFGSIQPILELDEKVVAEHLVFEREGRKHKHLEYENFSVISGTGKVVCGDEIFDVKPGSVVCIPPKTSHWMIPDDGEVLTGLLWYCDRPTNLNIGKR